MLCSGSAVLGGGGGSVLLHLSAECPKAGETTRLVKNTGEPCSVVLPVQPGCMLRHARLCRGGDTVPGILVTLQRALLEARKLTGTSCWGPGRPAPHTPNWHSVLALCTHAAVPKVSRRAVGRRAAPAGTLPLVTPPPIHTVWQEASQPNARLERSSPTSSSRLAPRGPTLPAPSPAPAGTHSPGSTIGWQLGLGTPWRPLIAGGTPTCLPYCLWPLNAAALAAGATTGTPNTRTVFAGPAVPTCRPCCPRALGTPTTSQHRASQWQPTPCAHADRAHAQQPLDGRRVEGP